MSGAASRRLNKELADIKASGQTMFSSIELIGGNILEWKGVFTVEVPPYNGAFLLKISFPSDYPFKPPKLTFLTKTNHPNISEQGDVMLPMLELDNWVPQKRTDLVLQALQVDFINPEVYD